MTTTRAAFSSRMTEVEEGVVDLRQGAESMKKNINGINFRLNLLGTLVIIFFVKTTVPAPRMIIEIDKLVDEGSLQPYWMLFVTSVIIAVFHIIFLGTPPLASNDNAANTGVKYILSQAYQVYLIVDFVRSIISCIMKTMDIWEKAWSQESSMVNVIWNTVIACAVYFVAGSAMSACCNTLALVQATVFQVKFVRAHHPPCFEHPEEEAVYPGDKFVKEHLCRVNGPLFAFYLNMNWFFFFPCVVFGTLVMTPAVFAYCWFVLPASGILWLLTRTVLGFVLEFAYPVQGQRHEISIFGVDVHEIREDDVRHMQFVVDQNLKELPCFMGKDLNDEYKKEISTLYTTNLTHGGWRVFFLVSVMSQMLCSFLVTIGVRLCLGYGYTLSLTETLTERHWYLYLQHLWSYVTSTAVAIAGFF